MKVVLLPEVFQAYGLLVPRPGLCLALCFICEEAPAGLPQVGCVDGTWEEEPGISWAQLSK